MALQRVDVRGKFEEPHLRVMFYGVEPVLPRTFYNYSHTVHQGVLVLWYWRGFPEKDQDLVVGSRITGKEGCVLLGYVMLRTKKPADASSQDTSFDK